MAVPETPLIRPATEADADGISRLTIVLAERWIFPDCDAGGARYLREYLMPEAVAERMRSDYVYYVAVDAGEVVGIAAIRPPAHLYNLFVAERAQRHGLASALWDAARRDFFATHPACPVTVNASRHAVAVYEKLGFIAQGPERVIQGIPSTPMLWQPPQT
jgi:GNAT superfamily N-acetyltransferase